ncbi:hypothetical protein MYAM1_000207 [Malassezia yamatoensis]|uniref:RNA-binding S4 domain-containing protein n=1 Tax=Malassezia yamatoensis TaxID=253288 RepID=A0AAJ5YQT6_9BASI|nr:hypothetical protein MYAM1_000207 [Malassezia yamatoensis]
MFQQRFRSKRLLRGYHGDWIPETRFRRWFLPTNLPSYAPMQQKGKHDSQSTSALDSPVPPVASLFLREVERRLDVIVFRCCFAHSAYHSRSLIVHGKVKVNGIAVTDPNKLLEEGDLITVEPESVPMLNPHVAKRVEQDRKLRSPKSQDAAELTEQQATPENTEQASEENVAESSDAPKEESSQSETSATDLSAELKHPKQKQNQADALPQGVLPFHLPPFAAPFLFIPPYLDVSFRTCSAIYLRHPTLTTHLMRSRSTEQGQNQPRAQRVYHSDIPTPYPAGGEMYGLAWEFYVRNAPRVRGDERRTKVEGRYGRFGFLSARAWERDRLRVATRRGWGSKRLKEQELNGGYTAACTPMSSRARLLAKCYVVYKVNDKAAEYKHAYRSPTPILDVQWYIYPAESDDGEVHWCFAVSSRDIPLRLINAYTGEVKITYAIIDHTEKHIAAMALAFSKDGARLYGGLTNAVAIYPLAYAGVNRHVALELGSELSETHEGNCGIVSTLATGWAPRAFDEENCGVPLEILAVGTFSGFIGIYVSDPHWLASATETRKGTFVTPPRHGAEQTVSGASMFLTGWHVSEGSGISQVTWHPKHREILVVAPRRADCLLVYDTSYFYGSGHLSDDAAISTQSRSLIARLKRPAGSTHQRFWLDMDSEGEFLAAGDEKGMIRIWAWESILTRTSSDCHIPPVLEWQAHQDAVGSVQFNQKDLHTLMSVSGARHWDSVDHTYDTSESDTGSEDIPIAKKPFCTDNSATFWRWSVS